MTQERDATDEVDIRGALGSIGISAVLILGGTFFSQVFGLTTRVVMTRYLPLADYGNVALGITILNVLGLIALLGMTEALPRFIPRAEDALDERRIVGSVFQVSFGLAVLIGIASFLSADLVASAVFDEPSLSGIVRIFSLSLPFYVLYRLSLRGIQGYGKTFANVVVKNAVEPVFRLAFVVILVLAGFGLYGAAAGYALGFVVAGIAGVYALLRTGSLSTRSLATIDVGSRRREILSFSLPLAVTGGVGLIAQQSDILVLGILSTSEDVGVYDVAFLAAQFLLVVSPAINYLFQPLVSGYEKEGEIDKMAELYTITTRWAVVLPFPLFVLFFLFPEQSLGLVFGPEYRRGGAALSILVLGYYLDRFTGFSGSLLAAMGKTNVIMYISVITHTLNVLLNVVLIAMYGIIGAAIATAVTRILNNSLKFLYLHREAGIHPFKPTFIRPVLLMMATVTLVFVFQLAGYVPADLVAVAGITGGLSILFFVYLLVTKSVYTVELELLESLFGRLGVSIDLTGMFDRFVE